MSWLKELEKKVGKVALAEKAPKPAAKRADPRAKIAATITNNIQLLADPSFRIEKRGEARQTLRDWVIRFNDAGPEGLSNKPSPGAPGKLTSKHKEFLARLIDEGPVPAIDGVVRWRACDLLRQLHAAFGLSVSDATVYRALKELGFSHVSARPKAYKQDPEAMAAFKKISPGAWRRSARNSRRAHR